MTDAVAGGCVTAGSRGTIGVRPLLGVVLTRPGGNPPSSATLGGICAGSLTSAMLGAGLLIRAASRAAAGLR